VRHDPVYVSSVIDAGGRHGVVAHPRLQRLPLWHPAIADSRIENNAAQRPGRLHPPLPHPDGGMIRERLLALRLRLQCTYEILESPMGVENYVATLKLTPVTDGNRCFAEWSAEFDCAEGRERELTQQIGQGVFQGGFDALKRHFGSAGLRR
jgi:hypothetical protein